MLTSLTEKNTAVNLANFCAQLNLSICAASEEFRAVQTTNRWILVYFMP
jgi:hypothetical protein